LIEGYIERRGRIVDATVNHVQPFSHQCLSKLAHGGKENRRAHFAAPDHLGLTEGLGYPNGILQGIKTLECQAIAVELIAENDDEITHRR
jgi:hypothetical protein